MIPPPVRLTPDITIRARMPTRAEYDLHLELLRALLARRCEWTWRGMSQLEHDVWCACHAAGLVTQEGIHGDGAHVLTRYGREYLRQRSP